MITQPKIEHRNQQPFAAVRAQVPIPFGKYLQPLWEETHTWLESKGVTPSGAPFIRYLTTDMSKKLDIEVGFPIASPMPGNDRVRTGVFPAGKYAVMMYTGSYRGKGLVKATAALLEWAQLNHIAWNKSIHGQDEWWEARLEWYITNPRLEPDPKKWQTEMAFLINEK